MHHPSCPARLGHPECTCVREPAPSYRLSCTLLIVAVVALYGSVAFVCARGWGLL